MMIFNRIKKALTCENMDKKELDLLGVNDLDIQAEEIGIGGEFSKERSKEAYRIRMQKRKEIQKKRLELRKSKKGLVIVFTGNGKGKTTAALGMALRMLGHGHNVAIIQFIKGGWNPGEQKALKVFGDNLKWHSIGEGFTWETQDKERDKYFVKLAWEKSLSYITSKDFKLVILDELNIALKLGYISTEEVINGLSKKPINNHIVITGRGATKELITIADLVTEMNLIHHPFKEQGIKAQEGIEF